MSISFDPILIIAAVIPAIILLVQVEKADRLEKESPGLLVSLVLLGIVSTTVAELGEQLGIWLLGKIFSQENLLYDILLYFGVVALSEEGAKYVLLKKRTWNHPEFNCQFDGVVYGVFVSLGFALWENIGYVAMFGLPTALIRAVTAVPGHACFGVFMGAWYGMAKRRAAVQDWNGSKSMRRRALLLPAALHGFYDFTASAGNEWMSLVFIVFVVLMFVRAYRLAKHVAANDEYIQNHRFGIQIIDDRKDNRK
jgi:RsiW-degrading membrane proteinase PrsW (M82 family)